MLGLNECKSIVDTLISWCFCWVFWWGPKWQWDKNDNVCPVSDVMSCLLCFSKTHRFWIYVTDLIYHSCIQPSLTIKARPERAAEITCTSNPKYTWWHWCFFLLQLILGWSWLSSWCTKSQMWNKGTLTLDPILLDLLFRSWLFLWQALL